MATAYTLFGLVIIHGFLASDYGDYGADCCDDGAGGEEEALRPVLLYALTDYTGRDNHLSSCEHDLLLCRPWPAHVGAGLGDASIRAAKEVRRQDHDCWERLVLPHTPPSPSQTRWLRMHLATCPLLSLPLWLLSRANQPLPETSKLGNRFTFLKYLRRRRTAPPTEWTDRLASLADKAALTADTSLPNRAAILDPTEPFTMLISPPAWINTAHAAIVVRAEGPYFTPADPARYHTVVAIVAGTGISGALAIIGAFAAQKTRDAENAADVDTPWNLGSGSANPPHWQRKAEAGCCEDAGGREGGREEDMGLSVGTESVHRSGGGSV
ncbi:hypothetical protein V497_07310 [Pseudogymnoascus sp. VKM F-4516 (FW-969)]|nr:hypothetical protein V497_07310 [Pseudogymnoascus sp. VKM F-4516 (FW-969)]